ncbi:hypothetical protein [Streptomyces sp. FIT100]|uniref:hypothetical protein n=1 Tax=Streptomyces sp. FIT100 TaxID=2837956 RepID=UPI0021C7DDC0|nr:hypothetical protein [Streptomyces sp. FIT100]UUN25391.1 hypothetical protein KK483_02390 [Streptomyces sp. FIT100]
MSYTYDSFSNRGEYLSAHYFSEELENTLKKSKVGDEGLFTLWTSRETDPHDPQPTPRELLPRLRGEYLATVRPFLAARAQQEELGSTYDDPTGEWAERLTTWHTAVLKAFGYGGDRPEPITVHNAGKEYELQVAWHGDGILAVDCGWTAKLDDALDLAEAGQLLHPLKTADGLLEVGEKLAGWLFQSELHEPGGDAPRFILLLCGGVLVLADRRAWAEGRYLAASLDAALARNDTAKAGELALLAALFSHDMLAPRPDGKGRRFNDLLKASRDNAVGVNSELRKGLQQSVEIIANEVLARLRKAEVEPREIEDLKKGPFAKQLTRESLRYLYRILFLLYAEARPELGILPADDSTYQTGYSIARLRELVARERKLVEEDSRNGFHLFASLDVLFNKVNYGHRPHGTEADDDKPAEERSELRGLRFEPLRSELFDPKAITLIGRRILHPRWDEDGDEQPRWLDLRLRNEALHQVLRLLTMKEAGQKGRQGGFISYRNLGINQLGAVYEGLMSYTGIIAEKELAEVARPGEKRGGKQYGEPEKGSWLIPADRLGDYPENTWVVYSAQDAEQHGLRGPKKYAVGEYVYRLAGRDRETSASYYTPESLTKVTVELALKHRLTDETRASDLLKYTICEPALGSGAFLNEAINQVADEYLKRRQEELGVSLDTSKALDAKQKVKAYIALHNAYGIDLNATGVELAEVSLWLNTMHPGMRAPWFGLHLRRGNSLIGARRWVYEADRIKNERTVGGTTPVKLPFRDTEGDGAEQALPEGAVHQFLLPTPGWGAVALVKPANPAGQLIRQSAKPELDRLIEWRKAVGAKPKATGGKGSQLARLQEAAKRVEFLWQLVGKRMELSEREIARTIDVWGTGREEDAEEYAFLRRDKTNAEGDSLPLTKEQVFQDLFEAEGSPYWRLKQVMDAWCALCFWPLDQVGMLDGTDAEYETPPVVAVDALLSSGVPQVGEMEPAPAPQYVESGLLFALNGDQLTFGERADESELVEKTRVKRRRTPSAPKKGVGTAQRRPVIALKDLDDWLAFLESMVGTGSVPEETFATSVDSLEELKVLEEAMQGEMGMDDARKAVETRYPWMRLVRDIAKEQGFLHWELDFAGVFASETGGFDLQVGNPPWVEIKFNRTASFSEFEPHLTLQESLTKEREAELRDRVLQVPEWRIRVLRDAATDTALASFYSSAAVYPILAGTPAHLHPRFMSQCWDHAAATGAIGLVHPDGHLKGKQNRRIRAEAYRRLRVHGAFVNVSNWAFPQPVGHTKEFAANIYGPRQEVNFKHLSFLYRADVLTDSLRHDGSGPEPGLRFDGQYDTRPHRARIINVNAETLALWSEQQGGEFPAAEAEMMYPLTQSEQNAVALMAKYPIRLSRDEISMSRGYDEERDRTAGYVNYRSQRPASWDEAILHGPHIGPGTPFCKEDPELRSEGVRIDLTTIPADFIPATKMARSCDRERFESMAMVWRDWQGQPHARHYRLAFRRRNDGKTERVLQAGIIPPGPTHVHGVHSLAFRNRQHLLLVSGFWSAIPLDYMLRAFGMKDLYETGAQRLPAPSPDHPLARALAIRSARLNCLSSAYADLWESEFRFSWLCEEWAIPWTGLRPLNAMEPRWSWSTPLRTEFERRAALVELDALAAVWMGLPADALIAAYQARLDVLSAREEQMYFDERGRQLASDRWVFGTGQTGEHWKALVEHLAAPDASPVPDGYTAPFYKADREREMRAAHAYFKQRLDEAVAKGLWDPEKMEVPTP